MCWNAYEFTETREQRDSVDRLLGKSKDLSNFDGSILNAFLATEQIGTDMYNQYSPFLPKSMIAIIVAFFWLTKILITGVGVGESLRS